MGKEGEDRGGERGEGREWGEGVRGWTERGREGGQRW